MNWTPNPYAIAQLLIGDIDGSVASMMTALLQMSFCNRNGVFALTREMSRTHYQP